jgi:hypothetical protein
MFILKLNVEASTPEVAIEIQIAMLLHFFKVNLFSLSGRRLINKNRECSLLSPRFFFLLLSSALAVACFAPLAGANAGWVSDGKTVLS